MRWKSTSVTGCAPNQAERDHQRAANPSKGRCEEIPPQLGYGACEPGKCRLAFIHALELRGGGRVGPQLRARFGVCYIASDEFTLVAGSQVLAAAEAEAVTFGNSFWRTRICPKDFAATPRSMNRTDRLSTHAAPRVN
jgi:hypothetical protein